MIQSGKLLVLLVTFITLAACSWQAGPEEDETPLSASEGNWKTYGVNDPRLLDWMDMHNNTRMELSESLTNAVEQLDGVAEAVVIRTDTNAYVGVRTVGAAGMRNRELTDTMRARIILAVKTTNSKVMNVYASGRPEVFDALSRYASKLESGVSERNLVRSFNANMKQYFPYSVLGQ